MRTLNAASAIYPGRSYKDSFAAISAGIEDPVLGMISMEHAQICPQHPGFLTGRTIERLLQSYPETAFRLHASPKMGSNQPIIDASNAMDHMDIVRDLAELSRSMKAAAYSFHAGEKANSTLADAFDTCRSLEDLFQCPVAIEGLYPISPRRPDRYLLSDWSEHEQLITAGVAYAIDLSHLAIVATKYGREDQLVSELLSHPNCIEIHVSDNDGRRDIHQPLDPR